MFRVMFLTIVFLALMPGTAGSSIEHLDNSPILLEKSDNSLAANLASKKLEGLVQKRLGHDGAGQRATWRVRRQVSNEVRGSVNSSYLSQKRSEPAKSPKFQDLARLPEQDPGNERLASMVSERCLDLAEAGIRSRHHAPAPVLIPSGGLLYCGDVGQPLA